MPLFIFRFNPNPKVLNAVAATMEVDNNKQAKKNNISSVLVQVLLTPEVVNEDQVDLFNFIQRKVPKALPSDVSDKL